MIGQTISHYKILEELGRGGMGVVYRAHDTRLDRDVALKFLPSELTSDPEAKRRFINEARAASALQHENICVIHDIDETADGQMFICMDYYEGQTLRGKIERGVLKIEDSAEIAAQVARGLTKAHTHGIVHRDVKPENIIVTGDNQVKIMDFGLAKLKGTSRLTRSRSTAGTLFYMSPEQAQGLEVDRRSDIFSLGVVLYEMITGRRPFRGEHEAAIIYSVLNETPEPLSRYAARVTPALQHVVDKAMTKEADERYQHADEMLADLKRVTGETRGVARQKPGGPVRPGLRRRPLLWTSAGLVAALAVVAGWYFLKGPKPSSKPVPPPTVAEIEWKNSLAVLPFRDFSSKKDQEYFCNGMTDAIIGRLAKIPELKVMATTSVMRYKDTDKDIKEIGRELNVANVLEGTLQREKNRIRLSAQLINAENGFHLWSDTYDGDARRVFDIQDNISQAIAEALKVQLTAGARATSKAGQPQSLETYEYHLKGMNLVNRYLLNPREEDFDAALSMFRKAIEIEPDYAASYTGLAWVYQHHMEVTRKEDEAAQVVKYSELAYQKNPNSPEANTAMGWVCHLSGDDDQAYKYLRRGLELNPNSMAIIYVTGIFYSDLGLCYQAIKFLERAVDLDPFYLYALSSQAGRWRDIGEFGKAESIYKKAMVLAPYEVTYPASYAYLLVMLRHDDRADELLKLAEKLKPGDPLVIRSRALLCAVTGNKEQALAVMQPSDEMVFAVLTMKEEAVAALSKKTIEGRQNMYLQLIHNPLYNTLRSDPRFQEIVNRQKKIYDDMVRRFGDL